MNISSVQIQHTLTFSFRPSARVSHVVTRLTPVGSATQRIVRHSLDVRPAPDSFRVGIDAFGNRINWIRVERSHANLSFVATTEVSASRLHTAIADVNTPWESARQMAAESDQLDVRWCRLPSPLVPAVLPDPRPVQRTFSSDWHRVFTPGRPMSEVIHELELQLMAVSDETNRAHALISVCRHFGLSARFVSGYVRLDPSLRVSEATKTLSGSDPNTTPPPGSAVEAYGRSSWASVWIGDGWIEVLGTASTPVVMIGAGRDARDVQPITNIAVGTAALHDAQEQILTNAVVDIS